MEKKDIKPKIGLVGMALPGLFMGEELCSAKTQETKSLLEKQRYTIISASKEVYSPLDARQAGSELEKRNVDCIVAVITTFVADYFITELLSECNKPIFLWIIDRELHCISLVCGPLITATLYNLGVHYDISVDDIKEGYTTKKIKTFTEAAMIYNRLKGVRIGFSGGHAGTMFSQGIDEFVVHKKTGVSIFNMPMEEVYNASKMLEDKSVSELWLDLKRKAGSNSASEQSGLESCRLYLALKKIVEEYRLDAICLNCYPYLKAKICLAVSLLNDELIASGCEGDINATILMYIVGMLTGKAALNADFLRIYNHNEAVFSHCGAGGFTLAENNKKIAFGPSIETNDGLAVLYETYMPGTVTLMNMVNEPGNMRLTMFTGETINDDSGYIGNPLRLKFNMDALKIYNEICNFGGGVHWIGIEGDYVDTIKLWCEFSNIKYKHIC